MMTREDLSQYAKEIFDESKALIIRWKPIYEHQLFTYCQTHELVNNIFREIVNEGALVEYTNLAGSKTMIENPKLKIYRDMCKLNLKQASNLGLTPLRINRKKT